MARAVSPHCGAVQVDRHGGSYPDSNLLSFGICEIKKEEALMLSSLDASSALALL